MGWLASQDGSTKQPALPATQPGSLIASTGCQRYEALAPGDAIGTPWEIVVSWGGALVACQGAVPHGPQGEGGNPYPLEVWEGKPARATDGNAQRE